MKISILTIFPNMIQSFFNESIVGRAQKSNKVLIECVDIRKYSLDKHKKTDDIPYGGGMGMVMTPQPIYSAFKDITANTKPYTVYLTPKGNKFNQQKAREFSKKEHLVILCGHYEGVDQRVLDKITDEEISLGDFVLTGGEIAAAAVTVSVVRLIDGVLSNEECYLNESLNDGLLEYPQYTRPAVWEDIPVPEVLLSGHHKNIEGWRRKQSVLLTAVQRPDLLKEAKLTKEEQEEVSAILAKDVENN